MAKRPTIMDVAHRAGVSKGLVSLALNGRPGVNAETSDRIKTVAREIGWRPNQAARSLSLSRAYALGFVLRRDARVVETDPFFSAFIAGAETALSERNYVLVLSVVSTAEAEARTYRTLVGDGRVDGVIVPDLRIGDTRIALLEELGATALTLGDPDVPSAFSVVRRDYADGIDTLVQHLVELGHSNIAHVAGDETMLHGASRRHQFEKATASRGLRSSVFVTDFSVEQGAEATHALLNQPVRDRATAIIYANDPMAIVGMGIAQSRGLRIPSDLSITGFDGSQFGRFVTPALTTLDDDPVNWGRTAATALMDALDRGQRVETTLHPADLIIRNSTGPAPRSH